MIYLPQEDGETHVNVYSKGRTTLGRLLTNFAHTPFSIDGLFFASVEAWWYWRKAQWTDEAQINQLRNSYGFEAKRLGQILMRLDIADPSEAELLRTYQAKTDSHADIRLMLRANKLPFDHYFVYDGTRRETRHRWTGQLWAKVKV